MSFDTLLALAAMDIFSAGAKSATYTPQGWSPSWLPSGGVCLAIVRHDTAESLPFGMESTRPDLQIEIDFLYAEIQDPRIGDQVTVGGTTYRIEAEIANDRYVVTAKVSEV